jgi:histidyl-tRNA synthetase
MVKGVIQLKNMESGDQVEVNVEELIAQIKN